MTDIPFKDLEQLCLTALEQSGFSNAHAHIIADHLLYNERAGKRSHGLLRLPNIVKGAREKPIPRNEPQMHLDLPAIGIVDGQGHQGLIAIHYAADQAISKAKQNGVSFIGARDYWGTTGTMHYHNKRIVDAGMVGILGCSSESMVSHPDGLDPVIGTNPISFAVPSADTPYTADVTTSEWAYGRLRELQEQGKPVPEGALIDKNGNPSTKIEDAFDGSMLPLSGYKGFALGLAVELLAGPLIGAKAGFDSIPGSDGFFIIAIDASQLGDSDTVLRQIDDFLKDIKNGRQKAEGKEIFIPGERADKEFETTQKSTTVRIAEKTLNDIKALIS